jgi:transposase-like protein
MKTDTIKSPAEAAEGTLFVGDDWFDPLEAGVRTRIRGFIEELLEAELDAALGRDRYERPRLARRNADDEGENDRRLTTSDTTIRPLNQALSVRSSLG